NEEEAISFINSRPKPLSLYIFSQSSSIPKAFISRTSSGSVCVNDTIVHLSVESLPFGGVGDSGYGNYHGRYSFQCFSHKKSVLSQGIGAFRYPPYSDKKARLGAKVIQPISLPFGRKTAAVALGWLLSLALGFACGRLL
ncbi:Aldehyde dehydrogenase, partial [Caligus rogercresseyi]